jgi:hypothetical protein
VIQNALRVVAYSMEKGNWGLVRFMLAHHQSEALGPYFLPIIAQVRLSGARLRVPFGLVLCCRSDAWHGLLVLCWLCGRPPADVAARATRATRAQEGKMEDMRRMLGLLAELGYDKSTYFRQQVHSALISAALAGQLDLMLLLQRTAEPLMAAAAAAAAEQAEQAEAGGSSSGDKSEL